MRSAAARSTTSSVVWRGPRVHDLVPLVPAGDPGGERCPRRVLLEQVDPIDQQEEVLELLASVRVEADVAVGGGLDRRSLERTCGGQRVEVGTAAEGVEEVDEIGGGHVGHFAHRYVDELSVA